MFISNLLKTIGWGALAYVLFRAGSAAIVVPLLFLVMGVMKSLLPKE